MIPLTLGLIGSVFAILAAIAYMQLGQWPQTDQVRRVRVASIGIFSFCALYFMLVALALARATS